MVKSRGFVLKFKKLILIAGMLFIPAISHAQWEVFDPASLVQQIVDYVLQVLEWKSQLEGMTDSVNALTGNNGFASLLSDSGLNQLVQINNDIKDLDSLASQANTLRAQYGSNYDCSVLKSKSEAENCLQKLSRSFKELAFLEKRLAAIAKRNDGLLNLYGNLGGASDVNSKAEAAGAINGQMLNTLNDMQQTMLFQQKVETERRIEAQKAYEDYQSKVEADQKAIDSGAPLWSLK